ncbi:MAG: carboxypeptidase regulatory-like domain-containing protein [Bacteroidetes bacterium]|nr:carboxypeptidase regulatory-like domain-containing protein [Bacteroidota bacterium]
MRNRRKYIILAVLFSLTAVLTGTSLLTGCKKNVGSITNIVKYDVSGYVLLSETSAAIGDVKIYLDTASVTTTDNTGKYVIPKLKPGSYLIKAVKDGYTSGQYNLTVSTDGAVVKAILLKKLAPAVTISTTGGTVTATNSTGSTTGSTGSLAIASGVLTSGVQISVTSLGANEVPKPLDVTGNVVSSSVTINTNDPNLNFTQGVTLTFNLIAMQKPGDLVIVRYLNEKTNAWEPIDNAIVNKDGLTASVVLHHFSTYSALITGSYTATIGQSISSQVVANSTNFNAQYEWQSVLEYRQNITNIIDPVWLYSTVEGLSSVAFSTISYGTTPSITKTSKNVSTISTPPADNPDGYRNYPKRNWELVQYTSWVYNTVSVKTWSTTSSGYVTTTVPSWYKSCFFVWVWRPDDTYALPKINTLTPPVTYVIVDAHNGGIGG